MAQITINGITLDPQGQRNELEAESLSTPDARGSNFALIQVDGPIGAAERQQLENLGVTLLEFVPEDTYIGRFEADDLSVVRALPFVIWANPYLKGFKVATELLEAPALDGPELMRLAEGDDPGERGRTKSISFFTGGSIRTTTWARSRERRGSIPEGWTSGATRYGRSSIGRASGRWRRSMRCGTSKRCSRRG